MKKVSIKRSLTVFLSVLSLSVPAFADFDDLFGGGGSEPAPSLSDTPGATIRAIDQSSIDDLFGVFEEVSDKPAEVKPERVLPPFHGDYKVLISRPVYAVFEAETRTKWISAMGEMYSHYKVSSFPRTHVFSIEQVNGVLPNYRDYNRRISRQIYIETARRLGATHILYQEYQPQRGNNTLYSMELFWIEQNATVVRATQVVQHQHFEAGLDICLAKIAEAMDPGAKNTNAFKVNMFGRDQKNIEAFGNALANEGNFSKERAAATYTAIERMLQRSPPLGFHYAAAQIAGRAENYMKAIEHINAVISQSGDHPALQLLLAEYMRGAGRYSEALSAAQNASRSQALALAVSIERAAIYQAQGNLDQAHREYTTILQSGQADGRVFFRLATLSIQMNRMNESTEYLTRAEQSGLTLDESEYFELGSAFAKVPGFEEQAMEHLRRSLGVRQSNEAAWVVIAEIHKRTGNQQAEAESYVNLAKLNMNEHKGRLKTAGEIYERIGMVDRAKDAYATFLERRFVDHEVSMSLARIYFNEKDCRRVDQTLRGIDTIPEAIQMLRDCGIARRAIDPSQAMAGDKMSGVRLTIRLSSVGLLVGGIAGGYYFNSQVDELVKEYTSDAAHSRPKADKLRKDIETNQMLRNVFYGAGIGLGLAGFSVTFLF
ncbi:MAG: hypothetical protein FWE57_01900 [Chitinispirillia bacterium]|nr:hypothetical protein [Chitinispirillia bacterium]